MGALVPTKSTDTPADHKSGNIVVALNIRGCGITISMPSFFLIQLLLAIIAGN